MHRHFITGQVVVDEKTMALVDHQFLHQRRAGAHRHAADHLAARGFRIQDAPGRAHGQHAPQADFTGGGVDRDFDKMRAKGLLYIALGQVAVFHRVFASQFAVLCRLGQGKRPILLRHPPIGELRALRVQAEFGRHQRAQLDASRIYARRRRGSAPLAARSRRLGKGRVAQPDDHLVHADAHHFGRSLGDDAVAAGADIGHVGLDGDDALAVQPHPGRRFGDRRATDGRRHANPNQPAPFPPAGRCSIALLPAKVICACLQALHQLPARKWSPWVGRVDLGVIDDAKFDRIQPQFFRHLVHRDFERHHARRFARRAHGAAFRQIELGQAQARHAVGAGVQHAGLDGGRFRPAAGQVARPAFLADGSDPAVPAGADAQALQGGRPVRDVVEHQRARQGHLDRPPHRARCQRCQHRVGQDRALAAKAAADIGRNDAHVLLRDAEGFGDIAHAPVDLLDRGP